MTLIDTHTHLYLEEFDDDREAMLQRAMAAGVERFYLPGIDSSVIDRMFQMEHDHPAHCFPMMGLHPCSVKEDFEAELRIVEEHLSKRWFPAIGEIGLDHYWDKTFADQQEAAFRIQIEWSLQYKLPIVIHTRNAMQQTIDIVKEYVPRGVRGIFHCFSGSHESATAIIKAGFYLGIGGVITYKNAGLAQVLEHIPLEHLVLETDAPYLTPVPYRGKRNESSYLLHVVDKLQEVYRVSKRQIAEVTTANAKKVFA